MHGLHQVDLAIGGQLVQTVLQGRCTGCLIHHDDVRQIDAGIRSGLHHGLQYILGKHHEVGDGLADDVVEGDEDGHGDEAPQAAAHGVDAFLFVELLHFLLELGLVFGVALLQLLHLTADAAHAHHALLGFHLEGQHDELDDQSKQDQSHTVGVRQVIEQTNQPGKGYANVVANGGHSCLSSDILLNQGTGS